MDKCPECGGDNLEYKKITEWTDIENDEFGFTQEITCNDCDFICIKQ